MNWFTKKIEEIQSRKRRDTYTEGKYFDIYTGEGIDTLDCIAIEIKKGKFEGVKCAYTSVMITKDGKLEYNIRIIDSPDIDKNILRANKNFGRMCGQILIVIIENAMQYDIEEKDAESGENYTEEFVQRRTIHPKNSPLSEE